MLSSPKWALSVVYLALTAVMAFADVFAAARIGGDLVGVIWALVVAALAGAAEAGRSDGEAAPAGGGS